MTIAEVSKKYDLTPDTLRYYERIGLLSSVPRNTSGIRNYDEASCKRIELDHKINIYSEIEEGKRNDFSEMQ